MRKSIVTQRLRALLRTACRLAAVTLTVALTTACQQDALTDPQGNTLNSDGTVTITRLQVGIGENVAAITRAADAASRAADPADPSRPGINRGYTTGVKTTFVEGDVLHLAVFITEENLEKDTPQLSTATLSGGAWTLKPAITLPQKVEEVYNIQIFYDGKSTEYNSFAVEIRTEGSDEMTVPEGFYDAGNFYKAYKEMSCHVNTGDKWTQNIPELSPFKTDANGNAYFHDALLCTGGTSMTADHSGVGSIAIGTDGTLSVKMAHAGCLLRIASVTNQLGSPVARAEVAIATNINSTLWGNGEVTGTPSTAIPGTTTPWQSVIGHGVTRHYLPWFIRITLADGRIYKIALPNADGSLINPDTPDFGLSIEPNKVYTYRLSLRPGALTAVPVTTEGDLAWTPRPDPAVPAGYTPIRTRADLEAIAASVASMAGNYILMNDIDLNPTTADAALWTPLQYTDLDPDGDPNPSFTGRFNGNGHTLHGLTIKSDSKQRLGLFAQLAGATIYNLHFSKANVTCTKLASGSERGIGTLAGYASDGSTISLCSATACTLTYSGEAAGSSQKPIAIGSLVGTSDATIFTQCHATRCTVTDATTGTAAAANAAGGLVGQNTYGSRLVSCYTRSCTVTGSTSTYAGGLTGSNDKNSLIYGCYAASPTVSGGKAAGALAGLNLGNTGLIASCYATLTPRSTGTAPAPGLVGFNGNPTSGGGSNADGSANPSGNAKIIACISPLTLRSQEQPTDNKANVVSITARGTTNGYLPLTDAKELAALTGDTGTDFATLFGFTTDGKGITDIRTVLVNTIGITITEEDGGSIPPGGIYVKKIGYTAAGTTGIWSTLKEDNKVIPPMIKW